MKKIVAFILASLMVVCLFGCGKKDGVTANGDTVNIEMSVKDFGVIKLELYPDIAPITVENFVKLAGDGFYDGLTFHRIVAGFMIQGGDPSGNGTGGSKDEIKGEFSANGVDNSLSHTRGVISMARRGDSYDSASSQFFICLSDDYTAALDGQYASFGKVTEGMDVVDAIAAVDVAVNASGETSTPTESVVIDYVKVVD